MTQLIWVTGRAAAGKSTVIKHLVRRLRDRQQYPVVFADEEPFLALLADDHRRHQHHCHPYDDDRIQFTSGWLFDEGLRLLNRALLHEITVPGVTIVEMARGRQDGPVDVTYRRALDLFDARLWQHSTVVRLDVDVDTQLARNAARLAAGIGTPDEIMRALYTDDDPDTFTAAGIPVHHLPPADPAVTADRILALTGLIDDTTSSGAACRHPPHQANR